MNYLGSLLLVTAVLVACNGQSQSSSRGDQSTSTGGSQGEQGGTGSAAAGSNQGGSDVAGSDAGGNDPGGVGGTGQGGSNQGGTGGATGGTGSVAFCEGACSVTPPDGGCLDQPTCLEFCQTKGSQWPINVQDSFSTCVATNPLCFESIEGCMLTELYPQGSLKHLRVSANGFDQFNGLTVIAFSDPEVSASFGGQTVIQNGSFGFDWVADINTFDQTGGLVMLYIDMDADGQCTAALDITHSESAHWNGSFLDPIYEITLNPPLLDADFVCQYAP